MRLVLRSGAVVSGDGGLAKPVGRSATAVPPREKARSLMIGLVLRMAAPVGRADDPDSHTLSGTVAVERESDEMRR
jgi:hypothetical protein